MTHDSTADPMTLSKRLRVAIAFGQITLDREAAIALMRIVEREEQTAEALVACEAILASYRVHQLLMEQAFERAVWMVCIAALCALVMIV